MNDQVAIPKEFSLSEEDKELLHIYHSSFNDDNIDVDLLMTLLIQIHCTQPRGNYFLHLTPRSLSLQNFLL